MSNVVSRSRLNGLNRLRCSIFQTSHNPSSIRTGAKYLRARFRGPSMVNYYPPKMMTIGEMNRTFPELNLVDFKEKTRLDDVEARKARGKGAPKKAKTEGGGRRQARKR